MIAISGTSPLILLDKAGYLWILGKLFEKVKIPPSVEREWLRPGGYIMPDWLLVENLSTEILKKMKKKKLRLCWKKSDYYNLTGEGKMYKIFICLTVLFVSTTLKHC